MKTIRFYMKRIFFPRKVRNLIDTIISHNERVSICRKFVDGYERGTKSFWQGMAHEIPSELLDMRFVRLFAAIPMSIMDADVIHIEVED